MNQLEFLIPEFGLRNSNLNTEKKAVKEMSDEIKKIMTVDGTNEVEASGYIAKLSERETESMNEAKLIELLKSENLTSSIKTREYVDMDMLEKAIYAGDIPQDVLLKMESCKEVKTTVALSVKKKKEKK